MRVRELLARYPKPVMSIESHCLLDDAVALMRRQAADSLVVTEEGRAVGIFSEREALWHGSGPSAATSKTRQVREAMLTHFLTASPQDEIGPLATLAQAGDIRHIPVIDQAHAVVGIVSALDLFRCHIQELAAELKFLHDYLHDLKDAGFD
jgi:CBS domain-containing protein